MFVKKIKHCFGNFNHSLFYKIVIKGGQVICDAVMRLLCIVLKKVDSKRVEKSTKIRTKNEEQESKKKN